VNGYEQHCADLDWHRGSRQIEAACVHCGQDAEQERIGTRWHTLRCEKCDEPVCLKCYAKLEEEEITCRNNV
jgi:hypothetical protein